MRQERILIVTDTWHPMVNGLVTTLTSAAPRDQRDGPSRACFVARVLC